MFYCLAYCVVGKGHTLCFIVWHTVLSIRTHFVFHCLAYCVVDVFYCLAYCVVDVFYCLVYCVVDKALHVNVPY